MEGPMDSKLTSSYLPNFAVRVSLNFCVSASDSAAVLMISSRSETGWTTASWRPATASSCRTCEAATGFSNLRSARTPPRKSMPARRPQTNSRTIEPATKRPDRVNQIFECLVTENMEERARYGYGCKHGDQNADAKRDGEAADEAGAEVGQ